MLPNTRIRYSVTDTCVQQRHLEPVPARPTRVTALSLEVTTACSWLGDTASPCHTHSTAQSSKRPNGEKKIGQDSQYTRVINVQGAESRSVAERRRKTKRNELKAAATNYITRKHKTPQCCENKIEEQKIRLQRTHRAGTWGFARLTAITLQGRQRAARQPQTAPCAYVSPFVQFPRMPHKLEHHSRQTVPSLVLDLDLASRAITLIARVPPSTPNACNTSNTSKCFSTPKHPRAVKVFTNLQRRTQAGQKRFGPLGKIPLHQHGLLSPRQHLHPVATIAITG